jgi:hypothetical protein
MYCVVLIVSCLLFSLVYGQGVAPAITTGILPEIFVHGDHFSVGQQLGYYTKDYIKYRLSKDDSITQILKWVLTTNEGSAAYQAMLDSANTTFPEYVEELEGMAYGSGIEFKTLFVLNTRNELSNFKPTPAQSTQESVKGSSTAEVEHCSDYLLNAMESGAGSQSILLGHNEDGGMESRDISFLVTVHVSGDAVKEEIKFTAFVYPGELPTDAFFWNEHGVIGTMNGLYPTECLYGGLGRNFVSRHLVGATTIDDAIARVTIPNQATGHSYNLASSKHPILVNVEVAPGVTAPNKESIFAITQLPAKSGRLDRLASIHSSTGGSYGTLGTNVLFHANEYKFLDVEQSPSDSSDHRMARAAELPPPVCGSDILTILGDTKDADWPIYRSATGSDTGYTLTTALFALDFSPGNSTTSTVTLYMDNPKTNAKVHVTKPLAYFF